MKNIVVFSVLSMMEYFALFHLAFVLFKFSIKDYFKQVFLTSLLLLYVSYSMRFEFDMTFLAPGVQIILFFLFLWIFFRIQVFYAAIMTAIGYFGYIFINTLMYNTLLLLKILTIEDLKNYSLKLGILPILTVIAAVFVAYILRKTNEVFTFVPHSPRAPVPMKGNNKILLITIFIATFVYSTTFYLYLNYNLNAGLLFSIVLFAVLGILFYLARRKEYHD